MRDIPNFGAPEDTLTLVVLGAVLATLGGFLAARLEAWLRRRERSRDAALLFGEILISLSILLKMARDSRSIGDPFGPVTMRMLQAARREIDIYDRNREALYDLTDPRLRVQVHSNVISVTMLLGGLMDAHQSWLELATAEMAPGARAAADARLLSLEAQRTNAFDFLESQIEELEPLVPKLGRLAGHSFANYEKTVRGGG